MLKFFKTYALFISMITGIVFYNIFAWMSPATKYLLFIMLLITYCKISPRQLKFEPLHLCLAGIQIFGCILVYFILAPFNIDLAEGCLICILAPTATSAPVITALLGGNIACLATYSIASNLSVAFFAPFIFSLLDAHGATNGDLSFLQAFFTICKKVMPLLLGPFILAIFIRKLTPKLHSQLQTKQILSFWLWTIALIILMAKTTSDLLKMDKEMYMNAGLIAFGAAVVCCLQFYLGRYFGRKHCNLVAGGQGLGQKNTILAIWMAQTFFNPIVAIAPASYVLWQNLINSYQLWKHRKELNEN